MSAPSTNIEKQSKRHRPAIWGIIAAGVFAVVLFLAYLANLAAQGNEPGEDTSAPAAAATTDG
ncbi:MULTISPECIES: hypothetical protein [Marivita]|uniref:Uncharacterized protein n=1 Tax=Marivita cryptomonadis TaxID=505252 RepID=A0A9Q2NVN0_9RHOB|nr:MULTISPECIES: hypothetical protein [Marivita]MCR9167279.1 hypothetical protein [Paracoccaceae bacterium]MBM2320592.1 hypothetical protein [Marivita cryptomonadis]MBM2330172.1 hypothetical protein [Marivita cryptomonadis]MBM2339759.1 hypothetical protein [Marivita cryptomonadis]MBM2344418.1 hypothetical protein [Marivita cryptomonadis]